MEEFSVEADLKGRRYVVTWHAGQLYGDADIVGWLQAQADELRGVPEFGPVPACTSDAWLEYAPTAWALLARCFDAIITTTPCVPVWPREPREIF